MKYINIDFNNKKDTVEEFETIVLSVKKKKFLLGLVKKEIDINYHLVKVDNITLPNSIITNNASDLIKLKVENSGDVVYSNQLNNLTIANERTEIKIACDISQITDYISEAQYKEVIKFDVVLYPKNENEEKIIKSYAVELIFIRCSSSLTVDFNIADNIKHGIEHAKNNKIYLGDFNIQTISKYSFAEPVEWSEVSIYNKKDDFDDDVFLGESISLSNKNAIIDSLDKYKLKLRRLLPNTNITIPIYADLSLDDSPLNTTQEYVYFSIQYSIANNTFHKSHKFFYTLMPDKRSTALMTLLRHSNELAKLNNFKIITSKYQWLGNDMPGTCNCFSIRIGNYAESGTGKILINDFKIKYEYDTDTTSVILDKKTDLLENITDHKKYESVLSRIIKINKEPINKLPTEITFNNAKNSFIDFDVSVRHDAISNIPNDIASVVLNLSFKYKISNTDTYQTFESKIFFKIERSLGDAWLALDFGTSASVAAFANGETLVKNRDNPDNLLINLQHGLRNLISNYNNVEIAEKNTKFLSSDMMLRQGSNKNPVYLQSSNYNNDIVYLSPISDLFKQYRWASIPYLKSLIGMENIPDFSGQISSNNYSYFTKPGAKKLNINNNPIKVQTVLQNTYNIMIRDFVQKSISDVDALNKIILTVPNVFTPKHIESIKSIVDEKFPNIKKDYINFISESDAVAIYYLSNWHDINFGRENRDVFSTNDEYILVYDIGAGTTDITYFKIVRAETDRKEIEIIGKFGKNTAGNYLDYTIAMILEVEKPNNCNYSYIGNQSGSTIHVEELKNFIVKKIKPNLNNDYFFYINPGNGNITETPNPDYTEYNTSDIANHPIMQQFLQENSTELFDKFFSLFNRLDFSHQSTLQKGEFPIDTVIFTGRTIMFEKLKDAVTDELLQWTKTPNTHFVNDLDTGKLKSIVALGALEFAMKYRDPDFSTVKIKNRNIYARYGFLYISIKTGKWQFKEMLNPNTTPVNMKPNIVDGLTIYQYDTDKYNALPKGVTSFLDLRETATGFFVQSFSDDTANDINENNWQYVTSMFSFSKNQVSTYADVSKVKTKIIVNHSNDMIVTIGNYENDPQTPLKIDVNNSQTFKKSMWPYYMQS